MNLLSQLKESGEDFEFYQTTKEIIEALVQDIRGQRGYRNKLTSVLDVGAGNGKVLMSLKAQAEFSELLAIEKSMTLINQLPEEVLVVGAEFWEQSLLTKQVDVVFCNPPYSEFAGWAEKIIRQASAGYVYLVIPTRWEDSQPIADAVKYRSATVKVIGKFTFEKAEDRRARAIVHLIRVSIERDYHRESKGITGAFTRFFAEEFSALAEKFDDGWETVDAGKGGRRRPLDGVTPGPDYPARLVALYDEEMALIRRNYDKLGELDGGLMRELGISPEHVKECLFNRLKGLKFDYWSELFRNLGAIRSRLTAKSRQAMLEKLQKHTEVDFTLSNIWAIIVWAIKNANRWMEEQFIYTYEELVEKANVVLYKSNKKVWTDAHWRYADERPSRYALDYRIVTHRAGGVNSSSYSWQRGLQESAGLLLSDLLTLANNLGFTCSSEIPKLSRDGLRDWTPGTLENFAGNDGELLIDAKGFKNGNLHIRFNKRLMLAMNVEYGRLKGWLMSPQEAADELNDPEAAKLFNTHIQLNAGSPALLICA
jgi:hypothetical protein